nr:MAG TPA: hypothetical protein [Caudoviricetes sp.]
MERQDRGDRQRKILCRFYRRDPQAHSGQPR